MGNPTRIHPFLALVIVSVALTSCQDERPAGCVGTCPQETEPTLSGTYRSATSVNGVYQSFAFGQGSTVVYIRQKTCVEERDSGSAQLRQDQGKHLLGVAIEKATAWDTSFLGRGCPPLVPIAREKATPMTDPFPLRWIEAGKSFEIQVSPIAWMRFDKI